MFDFLHHFDKFGSLQQKIKMKNVKIYSFLRGLKVGRMLGMENVVPFLNT